MGTSNEEGVKMSKSSGPLITLSDLMRIDRATYAKMAMRRSWATKLFHETWVATLIGTIAPLLHLHRNNAQHTWQFSWGWSNYIRWAHEPEHPRLVGWTNHIQLGPLSILFYHEPLLSRWRNRKHSSA